jgi:DNA-binding Lrp family transcriptional regulator
MATHDALHLALLNGWQHDFPLVAQPFDPIARAVGRDAATVRAAYAALQADGTLSRIGGVFGRGAGGAATLAAIAVPADRLAAVAACVSAHAGVNHNYEREHTLNLWFVATGPDATTVEATLRAIEEEAGLPVLRLPMERAYRIDLGFDLQARTARAPMRGAARAHDAAPVAAADRPLAACVEAGLPLVERPYAQWAEAIACSEAQVLARLQGWLAQGTLRRFGAVVRHHELGFAANAMAVFDVPATRVDACGAALALQPGITLAYRRRRAAGWPYNLYAMVHGRDREAVREVLARVMVQAALEDCPRAVLFSTRRFKQTGGRYFRAAHEETRHAVA